MSFCYIFLGSNLSSVEVQHPVRGEDSSGTCQPVRTTKNVGRTAKSQQILSPARYKGRIGTIYYIRILLYQYSLRIYIIQVKTYLYKMVRNFLSSCKPFLSRNKEIFLQKRKKKTILRKSLVVIWTQNFPDEKVFTFE